MRRTTGACGGKFATCPIGRASCKLAPTFFFGVALTLGLLTGCVERRYVITSDPPGAVVLRNGQPIGATPVDDYFVYYGKYNFTLIKEGYETLPVVQNIPTPWYESFGVDFI